MQQGLDSAFPPTRAQAEQAYQTGIRLWGGYLSTGGAYNGWSDADFATAGYDGNISLIAYAFPVSNPATAAAIAKKLNAILVLDNARGDTADPFAATIAAWMTAAGNPGMYGQADVLQHWAGHYSSAVVATRTGDPHNTNGGLNLGVPMGNQWQGSHTEFGLGVDRGWYDDSFVSPPPAPVVQPTPPVPPTPPQGAFYDVVVHPGDSISAIAQAHGQSLQAVEQANPLLERGHGWSLIYPGDVVHIPGGQPVPAPPVAAPNIYVVRRGDTLSGIASAYHISLQAIENANPSLERGHRWGLIYAGDQVRIP